MPWVLRGNLKGPQGPQGIQGPKGDPGDTGDTGPAGTAATVAVGTTTTGAPGTNASVTQSGTPQARTFNFTIPRGATGATGAKGDQGEEGSQWHEGTDVPAAGLGKVGDWYIRRTGNNDVYQKTGASTWTSTGINLRGPAGADGDGGVLGGVKGWRTAAQSIPNGAWTAVDTFTGTNYQNIGSTATVSRPSASYCRVDTAGWWMVGASLAWAPSNSGRRIMAVETWTGTDPGVNNATRIIGVEQVASANSWTAQNGSTVVQLDANTNVRLYCYQSSGSALSTDLSAPTELWLTRIL